MTVEQLRIDGKIAVGLNVDLPDSPPLVIERGEKGFVMCGYLNINVASKLGVIAATVAGVRTCDDLLNAQIKAATPRAELIGIEPGMSGQEAVNCFSEAV